MTFEQDREKLTNLHVICATCGGEMRNLGEWPVQFPKESATSLKNTFQCARYMCTVCRQPHSEIAKGVPVGIGIII